MQCSAVQLWKKLATRLPPDGRTQRQAFDPLPGYPDLFEQYSTLPYIALPRPTLQIIPRRTRPTKRRFGGWQLHWLLRIPRPRLWIHTRPTVAIDLQYLNRNATYASRSWRQQLLSPYFTVIALFQPAPFS